MFRLSEKALYAVEAVLDIAYNTGANPVQSLEITRRQGIPRRYIEQALQRLVRGGVFAGMRGPSGGYRLVRKGICVEGLPIGISSRSAIARNNSVFPLPDEPRTVTQSPAATLMEAGPSPGRCKASTINKSVMVDGLSQP